MKHTLAVAALLGHAHALAAYGDAADQTTAWSASSATEQNSKKCPNIMRGQKTNVWHYTSKLIYKVAATTKTIDGVKTTELVCKEGPTTT